MGTLIKPRIAVDLFCGSGGTSTGYLKACAARGIPANLTAINHWTTAINSHSLNHPTVRHICENVETINPRAIVPGGHLNDLLASCECTFHSNARGGGPCNEQSRSQPWQIIRWITDLTVDNVMMENVPEFQHWGPLLVKGISWRGKYHRKSRPDPRRRGEYFRSFIRSLQEHGYAVEWRIQNAADYGDATNRRRMILIARRAETITWPEPSHGPGRAHPHRSARSIIDWSLKGKSIFARKKPLSPNTLKRIDAGLRLFGGAAAKPFLIILNGTQDGHLKSTARSVDEPLGTIAGNGSHHALVEPFLMKFHGDHAGRSDGADRVNSLDEPFRTIDTSNRFALVEPFITHSTHHGERRPHSIEEPLPTITGAHRGEMTLIDPIIVRTDQTGSNGHCCQSLDDPISTVVGKQNMLLCEPFVVKYYGTGGAKSLNQPLDTVTTRDRFMLVHPTTRDVIAELDILFRMLQPHELSAAHSFPASYIFTGTKSDQIKQVGNSVPVELARAHARALLG